MCSLLIANYVLTDQASSNLIRAYPVPSLVHYITRWRQHSTVSPSGNTGPIPKCVQFCSIQPHTGGHQKGAVEIHTFCRSELRLSRQEGCIENEVNVAVVRLSSYCYNCWWKASQTIVILYLIILFILLLLHLECRTTFQTWYHNITYVWFELGLPSTCHNIECLDFRAQLEVWCAH